MEYRQLKYILTTAECGSITEASKQLFISQPALSSFISKTESTLGVKLFIRCKGKLDLTYAGEKYVKAAKRIVSTYEKLEQQLADISQEKQGKIRLGITEMLLTYLAPSWREILRSNESNIEIEMHEDSEEKLYQMLKNKSIDMCILPLSVLDDSYYSVELHKMNMFIVAKSGVVDKVCPNHTGPGLHIRDVADLPILVPPQSDAFRSVINSVFASAGIVPSNMIECYSRGGTLRMAAAGHGICIDSEIALDTVNPGGPIEIYTLDDDCVYAGIYALFPKDAYVGRLEQHFIQNISKKLGALGAGKRRPQIRAT